MSPVSPEHQHQQDDQQHDQTDRDPSARQASREDRDVPLVETIAPVVDEVIDIARAHLEAPISVKIWTWEDRTFQVRVRHSYGRPAKYRYIREAVVQYHSRTEIVEGVFIEEDRRGDDDKVLHRETLTSIESPTTKKGAWETD